jgi:hypothetical protein
VGNSLTSRYRAVYVRGLLSEGERKSIGAMALRLPEANEQSRRQFLARGLGLGSQSGSLWGGRYRTFSRRPRR